MCLFQSWFPQDICLGVELLGNMVVLFLLFKRISIPSSIVAASVFPFVSCFICYYFLPFWGLSFHLAYSFLCCAKAFKFNPVPLVYFCFYFRYSGRWVIEDPAMIYVRVLPMFSSRSFIVSGLPFRSLIHFWVLGLFLGILFCSIGLYFCFVPVPYPFHDCSFVV